MFEMNGYSGRQFALVRIALGLYCAAYFATAFPHAAELFSSQGMLPDPSVNWFYGWFPNVLYLNDAPYAVQTLLAALAGASLLFALGSWRRTCAIFVWYGLACLFNRNNLFWSPAFPLVGWLLLATVFVPLGEQLSLTKARRRGWRMPKELYAGAWLVLAVSYSVSGLYKLLSPSWVDGTALSQALRWTWARDWLYPDLLLSAPPLLLQTVTWATLMFELLFVLLILFPKGRMIAWWGMTLTHFNVFLLLDLTDLTMGVLMFHMFVLDPAWLRMPNLKKKRVFDNRQPSALKKHAALPAAAAAACILLFSGVSPASAQEARLDINPLIPLRTQYNQLKRDCAGRRNSTRCKDLERKMLEKMKKLREICKNTPGDQRCGSLRRPTRERGNRMERYCFQNPHATKCIQRRERQRRREKLLRRFCGKNPNEKRCQPKRATQRDNRSYIARLCERNPDSVRCDEYKRKQSQKYGAGDDERNNTF